MILRLLAAAVTAALLFGCAEPRKPDAGFSADRGASGDNAAIVIGLAATRELARPGGVVRKPLAATLESFVLTFVAYDPKGDVLRHLDPLVGVSRRTCLLDQSADCDLGRITRHVLAVPAGDYAIGVVGATARRFGTNQLYHYGTRFVRQFPSAKQPEVRANDAGLIRWRIAPGEVIYLGDFVYNPYVFPASLQRIGRDDTAAMQVLESYANLRGRMAFRLPILGRQSQATDLNALRERFESRAFEVK